MSQRAEGSGCSQSREAPHTETEDRLRHGESAHLTHTARRPSTLLGLISPAGSVLWSSHFITVSSDLQMFISVAVTLLAQLVVFSLPPASAQEVTRNHSLDLIKSDIQSSRRTLTPRMPEQSNDYRVVVFGAGGVGKSSLVLRFVKGTFRDTYIPTVEDTYRQVISCDKSVCTLQITDTTGSHQFPAMQRLSISKGHAFILVFSITSRQSLEELKPIYQQVLAIKGTVESIPIMLVGNKSDETAQREVDTKVAEAQAAAWKCAFMETSAKTNSNVKELFQELLSLEKKRDMSLSIDGKRSGKQKRADKLKGKCSIM
ncbi:GTP-binding protein Di-Ras1 [Dissostichus eleginoides]|nr:GTP-binding protein Di-Ras1 [Dissostichus eleginoides]